MEAASQQVSDSASPRPAKVRLGVLLSGRGSNFINIADSIERGELRGCEIALVLSNIADAPGLAAARERGLPAVAQPSRGVPREEHDRAMLAHLQQHGVEYVILAGYMRVLTPEFLRTFPQRVLNIHPSLLPSFPGLHAQQQALEYGVKVAGCTVHFVDDAVDHGVIVMQRLVRVRENDTVERLSARILQQEHRLYPEAIARVLSGRYEVRGRQYLPK
ncbi:phosphoribosylglycinamide formyltransferase [Terriglobus aquaticus]|uniref:Phosphoribosylglycinamide formyltransferase n=1 Tax=Terriglobus aquaticus TaxID=940139 RepID=A0ABW9KID3_9BACT|nr:phosphoribosylglycinamide formyltransferase [Terriglobus aquaticus]